MGLRRNEEGSRIISSRIRIPEALQKRLFLLLVLLGFFLFFLHLLTNANHPLVVNRFPELRIATLAFLHLSSNLHGFNYRSCIGNWHDGTLQLYRSGLLFNRSLALARLRQLLLREQNELLLVFFQPLDVNLYERKMNM